jgi:hypothetical protein
MKDLNELQEQRAALMAERAELTTILAELEASELAAKEAFESLNRPGVADTQSAKDSRRALSDAIDQNNVARARAARIDKRCAHLEQLADAAVQLVDAGTAEQAATAQAERLTASRKQVLERLAQMEAEASQAIESAQFAEQSAADEMAQAIASGDNKAAKAAQSKMDTAIQAAREAQTNAAAGENLARALETQADALTQQLAEAQARASAARDAGRAAQRLILSAEWDAAAENLAAIGAELVVLLPEMGYFSMGPLKVPTFTPGGPGTITRSELLDLAKGKAA